VTRTSLYPISKAKVGSPSMNTGPVLLIIHQSPLRTVTETEALGTLDEHERALPRRVVSLDTRHLKHDVEGNHWRSSHIFIREEAAHIRDLANEMGAADIRYFGVAEVPHVLALGAYLGDERMVKVRDYDRDRDTWTWATTEPTLALSTLNPVHELVGQPGAAVLRVEISYPILDVDIEVAIGKERLSNIRIVPEGRSPAPGLVRSEQDVAAIRLAVRESIAALAAARPNADVIHLFVAAPVSVCFAIGQELRLRNGKDVQTYRYRSVSGDRALTPALLLSSGDVREAPKRLSSEETQSAQQLRSVWQAALEEVRQHAQLVKPSDSRSDRWYQALQPADALLTAVPFPGLKPMIDLIENRDHVSPIAAREEFEFNKDERAWHFSDELILAMFDAAGRDETRLRQHARLFYWHEYVHDGQGLTAYTSIQVGRLPNCLERVDYMADVYAICHQVDFLTRVRSVTSVQDDDGFLDAFIAQIDVALRSFWAFEPPAPVTETQERRLRRYLNWYWQRVRMRDANHLHSALSILAQPPCIEISGLRRRLSRERIFVVLRDPGGFDSLHIGVLLEDGRLRRFGNSADLSIEGLLRAFSQHDHEAIGRFFNALAEHVK
jgi:hypothetical protein